LVLISIGSDTDDDTAYAAAPIQEDGRVIGVIQLAAPLSAAQNLVWERWLALGGAVLAVTAVKLANAIQQAVTDEQIKQNAAALGAKIRDEDGLGYAVDVIKQTVGV
jgi:UDP:flavonoid glycosyltransferase YjiC (YdhE family)